MERECRCRWHDGATGYCQVTAVRDKMAAALGVELLGDTAQSVTAASMERREGAEFAFAEPLLAKCLAGVGDGVSDLVLCQVLS